MITEHVYLGHDNTIDLLLTADGAAVDLSAVTRMTLELDAETIIDSDPEESPDAFDWDTGTTGKLVLALGGETIEAGTYRTTLTVYDPTNADGIVWGQFNLVVHAA